MGIPPCTALVALLLPTAHPGNSVIAPEQAGAVVRQSGGAMLYVAHVRLPAHMTTMRIIGLAGWSGSGKTTLITKAIPRLIARGVRVSTIKHAHHGFDMDQPGKDSFMHRAAGATEVTISSANRWAVLHELRERAGMEPGRSAGQAVAGRHRAGRGLQARPYRAEAGNPPAPPTASRCCIRRTRASWRLRATERCRPRRCR